MTDWPLPPYFDNSNNLVEIVVALLASHCTHTYPHTRGHTLHVVTNILDIDRRNEHTQGHIYIYPC